MTDILCKNNNPAILSHHDIIISEFSIPCDTQPIEASSAVNVAPKLVHSRVKVHWTDEGQAQYESLVGPLLRQARDGWLDPSSQSCMSILLQLSNDIMNITAKATNETYIIGEKKSPRSSRIPKPVKKAMNRLARAHKKIKSKQRTEGKQDCYQNVQQQREH